MNQTNDNLTHIQDGSTNYEEAGMDGSDIIEVYDENGGFTEVITPDAVLELLNEILDNNLDANANKYGIGSDMYWKVVALNVAARAFVEQAESQGHHFDD